MRMLVGSLIETLSRVITPATCARSLILVFEDARRFSCATDRHISIEGPTQLDQKVAILFCKVRT